LGRTADANEHSLNSSNPPVPHQGAGIAKFSVGSLLGPCLKNDVRSIDGIQDRFGLPEIIRQRFFAVNVLAGPAGVQYD